MTFSEAITYLSAPVTDEADYRATAFKVLCFLVQLADVPTFESADQWRETSMKAKRMFCQCAPMDFLKLHHDEVTKYLSTLTPAQLSQINSKDV